MALVSYLNNVPSFDAIQASLPLYDYKVRGGQSRFPSPAQDYEIAELDLNKHLITNPPATFLTKVIGDSMIGAGIFPGSILVVNKALKPRSSNIVVALVDGELMVKRLYRRGGIVKLLSENPAYEPITFAEGQELVIWGVVTYVITPAQ